MNNFPIWPERGNELITKDVAFQAMYENILRYWKQRGKPSSELGDLLFAIKSHKDGAPNDPAEWSYWIESIDKITNGK